MMESIMLIGIGFGARIIVWVGLSFITKKFVIVLHPIFGLAAVTHYYLAAESYANYDFVNYWTVLGFVLPELFKIKLGVKQ